jgi:hypothetical protein
MVVGRHVVPVAQSAVELQIFVSPVPQLALHAVPLCVKSAAWS